MTITTFKGIHGTVKYHAESILTDGFQVFPEGKIGKAGKGVYFWRYFDEKYKSTALTCAEQWVNFSKKKKFYDSSKDCSLIKIDVEIEADKNSILDIDSRVRETFHSLYPLGTYPERSYGAKLDMFIEELESDLDYPIDLISIDLSVPELGDGIAFSNSFPTIIVKNEIRITVMDCIE